MKKVLMVLVIILGICMIVIGIAMKNEEKETTEKVENVITWENEEIKTFENIDNEYENEIIFNNRTMTENVIEEKVMEETIITDRNIDNEYENEMNFNSRTMEMKGEK